MQKQSNGYFWGILLLGFGLLLLAKTMGWFHINWGHILTYWPLLLIAAGLSLILGKGQSWSGPVTALLLAVAIPSAIINKAHNRWNDFTDDVHIDFDDESNNDNNDSSSSSDDNADKSITNSTNYFSENLSDGLLNAELNFEAGAGQFKIEGTTDKLLEANTESELGTYTLSSKNNLAEKTSVLNFSMDGKNNQKIDINDFDDIDNSVKMKLSDKPTWSMKLEVGAGKADFDFSDYKVQKLKISAGVSKIDLKLGNKQVLSEVDIEAGVASIDIDVPESVGCEFISKGALNLKDMDELVKVSDGLYRSANYDKAEKKIKIVYEGGLSTLKIRRH